jgi:DNA adenine methylase
VDGLIDNLKIHKQKHSLEYYQQARINLNKEQNPTKVASLFIYINKTCYNGLYRVNKAGFYNVPMGKYDDPAILDEDNLRACSAFLQSTDIFQGTFSHIKPQKNQFFYLDPPYHETYSGYDGAGFGDEQHTKLADFCRTIDSVGGWFMLSNSDTEFVRGLYKGYNIEVVSASRFISCKANERSKQNELIIRNYH